MEERSPLASLRGKADGGESGCESGSSSQEEPGSPCGSDRYDPELWPPARGDYLLGDPSRRVAVMTLASHIPVEGAAISGPCKTENLGIEKVVANVISNSNIRFLLVCGQESRGHLPGDAILSLHCNGIDEKGKIVGSKGAIPFIENLSADAVERFRRQIEVVDLIGLESAEEINRMIVQYSCRADPYPEPPFHVFKRRIRRPEPVVSNGDAALGSGVVLDCTAWLVADGT